MLAKPQPDTAMPSTETIPNPSRLSLGCSMLAMLRPVSPRHQGKTAEQISLPQRAWRECMTVLFSLLISGWLLLGASLDPAFAAEPDVYQTYGTHNPASPSVCASPDCIYVRKDGEPSAPLWPLHWSSRWHMYRVFKGFDKFPPPYDGQPPTQLKNGVDYETSEGATYYDSEWTSGSDLLPGVGAMRESYDDRCLPIFPIDNKFSCSFISLGNTAFFQTYAKDRPAGMPEYCLFSPLNHPPRRDFIRHLPYSKADSERLDGQVQAYSFWVDGQSGKPIQTGVQPDQTAQQAILFGYGFWSTPSPDRTDSQLRPYRHPQSFYFSGYPVAPANAPIVSQNYTNFSALQPTPETWSVVAALNPRDIPECHLFDRSSADPSATGSLTGAQVNVSQPMTWANIGVAPSTQ